MYMYSRHAGDTLEQECAPLYPWVSLEPDVTLSAMLTKPSDLHDTPVENVNPWVSVLNLYLGPLEKSHNLNLSSNHSCPIGSYGKGW